MRAIFYGQIRRARYPMARSWKTRQLIERNLGQHVALSVAAHLARSQLVPNPLANYDARQLLDTLDWIGGALLKVAPLYVREASTSEPRELTPAELEGAVVRNAATTIVLKNGWKLGSVTMKRSDLRQAIAILKSVGVQNVTASLSEAPKQAQAPDRLTEVAALIAELEKLLEGPVFTSQMDRANRLAVAIARRSPHGSIANRAMQVMNVLNREEDDSRTSLKIAVAALRRALAEARTERAGAHS